LKDDSELATIKAVPQAIIHWRLAVVREVVFTGFQLDLYVADERAFAYWYASQVIHEHLSVVDDLLHVVPEGTTLIDIDDVTLPT
jgi:N-alpha-acetyltransferase 35, NatC auxiliary subunit